MPRTQARVWPGTLMSADPKNECVTKPLSLVILRRKFPMRTLSTFAAAAALIAGLATASQAQTPVNPLLPVTGTREIAIDGNIQFDPSTDITINGSYGPFLNPNLQVGGNFGYSKLEDVDAFYSLGAFANYHF